MTPLHLDSIFPISSIYLAFVDGASDRVEIFMTYINTIRDIYICIARSQRRMRREPLGDSLRGRWQGYWSRNANPPRAECVLMGVPGCAFSCRLLSCVPGFRGSISSRAIPRATLYRGKRRGEEGEDVFLSCTGPARRIPVSPLASPPTNPFEVTIERLETSSILSVSCSAASVCFFLLTSDE